MQTTRVCCSCWCVVVSSRPRRGEDCVTVPLLDITHSASSQLCLLLSCCLSCFLSPLRTESFLPSSFSFLIYSILLVPSSWLFFLTSRIFVFLQTKAPLSLFICTVLPWFYLPLLPIPLIFILPVVSHIPFLMCPRVCYSPSLSSFLSYLTSRLPHHHHPFLLLSHVCFVFFPPSVFSLIVLSRADRHCLWDVYRQNA